MKVTFLGTAAATAMPLPFCGCEVCKSARKLGGKDIRRRSSIIIDDKLMIDLGSDSVTACCEFGVDLSKLEFLLQTHAHSDHFDAGHLITRHPEYAGICPQELVIAATEKTLCAMNKMLKDEDGSADIFSAEFCDDLKLRILPVNIGERIQLGEYNITALDSHHDPRQDAVIYYVEKNGKSLLYATDMLTADEEFYSFLSGKHPDMIVFDQTYGEGVNSGGHLDAGMIYDIIARLRELGCVDGATKIYATHISHEGNHTHDRMQELAEEHGCSIAYDGLEVIL